MDLVRSGLGAGGGGGASSSCSEDVDVPVVAGRYVLGSVSGVDDDDGCDRDCDCAELFRGRRETSKNENLINIKKCDVKLRKQFQHSINTSASHLQAF